MSTPHTRHPARRPTVTRAACRLPRRLPLATALLALGWLAAGPAGAQSSSTLTWTGNGASANWTPAGVPVTGNWGSSGQFVNGLGSFNTLVFAGTKRLANTNNYTGLQVWDIRFAAGAGAFTLGGNALALSGGLVNASSVLQTLTMGVSAAADQTWDGGTAGLLLTGTTSQVDGFTLVLANATRLQDSSTRLIGHNGLGTLTVQSGSSVSSQTVSLGDQAAGQGVLTVRGAASSFAAVADLNVGNLGDGTMNVQSGAQVSNGDFGYLGRAGGSGQVMVTDAGSRWAVGRDLYATQGDLTVTAGGAVSTGNAYIAKYTGTAASVTVQGAGSRLDARGQLNLGAGGQGTLSVLNGGTVAAADLALGATGVLNLQGGTLQLSTASSAGTVGSFNWYAGTLQFVGAGGTSTGGSGLLGISTTLASGTVLVVDQQLSVAANTELVLLGGQVQASSLALEGSVSVGAFSTLAVGPGGLDNRGALQLGGGTLGGVGALVNNGFMGGYGVIAGSGGFTNNGLFEQSGGSVTLANTGANLNTGNWDLLSGRGLVLAGVALDNAGGMSLNGDTVAGTGAFTNLATGTLSGRGVIATAFRNAGRLVVDAGSLRVQQDSFENSGLVLMGSSTASLSGGVIYNSGRIQGSGQINNGIDNTGSVVAVGQGATLVLASGFGNNTGGTLAAEAGATLLLRSFDQNLGRIQITGGTLDTDGHAFVNAASGVISGAGTLRGGLITNLGRVLLSGGTSNVFAPLATANASQVILSGNSNTTFYGAVDFGAGSELRVSAGSVATFFELVQQRTGARFTGSGTKRFEGGISVGASPGLGTDEGDVEFGEDNVYLAEIGGTTACTLACGTDNAVKNSSFDKYIVAGQLTLGGTLKLVSWNGFVAQAGQRFDLLDWGTLSGTFNAIDATGFTLASGTALDYGALYTLGEVRVVASVVPEPGMLALWLCGLAGLGGVARRRRSAASASGR